MASEAGEFNLIVVEVESARIADAAKAFGRAFNLDDTIATQICKSAPIIFAQKLTKQEVKAITPTLGDLSKNGMEFRVTARVVTAPDGDVASEIALCVREDGGDLTATAKEAGLSALDVRWYLDDVDAVLRERLIGARPGELLGPIPCDGAFALISGTRSTVVTRSLMEASGFFRSCATRPAKASSSVARASRSRRRSSIRRVR